MGTKYRDSLALTRVILLTGATAALPVALIWIFHEYSFVGFLLYAIGWELGYLKGRFRVEVPLLLLALLSVFVGALFLAPPPPTVDGRAQNLLGMVLLSLAICPAAGFVLGTFARQVKTRYRLRKFECAECGYNLFGNKSGVCPECGTTIRR